MIRVTIEKENEFVVQASADETSREAKEPNAGGKWQGLVAVSR